MYQKIKIVLKFIEILQKTHDRENDQEVWFFVFIKVRIEICIGFSRIAQSYNL